MNIATMNDARPHLHVMGRPGRQESSHESDPVKDDHAQRMLESLDNPIWFALITEHRLLARSHGLARRYPPDERARNRCSSPAHTASRDDIRRMFHRWQRCFIPRMTQSPIYKGW